MDPARRPFPDSEEIPAPILSNQHISPQDIIGMSSNEHDDEIQYAQKGLPRKN